MTSLREFRNSLVKDIVWVGIIMTPLNGMLFELIFRDLFFGPSVFWREMWTCLSLEAWQFGHLCQKSQKKQTPVAVLIFQPTNGSPCASFEKLATSSLYIYSFFVTMLKAQPQQRDIFLLGLPKWYLRWCFFFRVDPDISAAIYRDLSHPKWCFSKGILYSVATTLRSRGVHCTHQRCYSQT